MSQSSDQALMRAQTKSSAASSSHKTTTELDVLTCELLRGTLLSQGSQHGRPVTPDQHLSAYLTSFADLTYTSQNGPGRTNTTLVISRGLTPQRQGHAGLQQLAILAGNSHLGGSDAGSIPYYDLSNYSRLLNTLNLLQSDEYENPVQNQLSENQPESSQNRNALVSEQFNQVPHRFSQFILDQNNVVPVPASSIRSARSGNISCLMGSQATIFSTRSNDGLRRRAKFGRTRSTRTTRISLDSSGEGTPTLLERRKAIRSKDGGKLYRLRLVLRKIALKIRHKFGAVRRFLVGPKKATSKAKTRSARPFLRQKSKRNSKIETGRLQISAPLANPGLESSKGALKVEELTKDLKARAGASGEQTEQTGKSAHLSQYLMEQKNLSQPRLGSETAFLEASVAPPPPPHKSTLFKRSISRSQDQVLLQGAWKQYLSHVLALRIKLRQEVHLFQLLLANQPIPSVFNTNSKLPDLVPLRSSEPSEPSTETRNARSSRRWLESVGEIKSHRASLVPGKYSSSESEATSFLLRAASSLAPTAPSESPSHFTEDNFKAAMAERTVTDGNSIVGTESDDDLGDERIEKLQTVLNRRSMLGEMLDYDSDELASLSSSVYSNSSIGASAQDLQKTQIRMNQAVADSHVIKRYGTLRRRHTDKSSYYGSSNGSSQYPDSSSTDTKSLSRSPAFNNLQEVTAPELVMP